MYRRRRVQRANQAFMYAQQQGGYGQPAYGPGAGPYPYGNPSGPGGPPYGGGTGAYDPTNAGAQQQQYPPPPGDGYAGGYGSVSVI